MEEVPGSSADVQRIFNQWLNAPELRSEVRGYLRHRLYTALHNSKLGPSLSQLDAHPVSPKLQTLNLLIAEYLLKQRHHFTLSVFSCEAPNVSCISPNVPELLKNQAEEKSSLVFSKEDFEDIIETLGLRKDSEHVQKLRQKYQGGKHQALITCILRILPELFVDSQVVESPKVEPKKEISSAAQISAVEKLYRDEIKVLLENFHQELHIKDTTIDNLEGLLKKYQQTDQTELLPDQLREMEVKLKNFESLKEKEIHNLKRLNRSLENELEEVKGAIETRKKTLREEEFRVEQEKLALRRNKKKLQKHQKQLDEVSLALTENFPDQSMLPALEIQLQMKDQEVIELRSKYLSLQDENKMLNSLTTQQRSRIESLNDKISSLVGELHFAKERALRSRQSASEGDSSPTEDLVKDAKQRIRSLEIEFEAIEKQHQDFKSRSMEAKSFDSLPFTQEAYVSPSVRQSPHLNKTPNVVEEIQTSIKALYDSVQPKPERLSPRKTRFEAPRVKLLDLSASSISSESTGVDFKPIASSSGIKSKTTKATFAQQFDESISPILPELDTLELENRALNRTTQLASSHVEEKDEQREFQLNVDPEPLAMSDELRLTIPSSSSGESEKFKEAAKLESTVKERVKSPEVVRVGRREGDGMAESSTTSEDKSSDHVIVTTAKDDDDNFWDM